MEKQKSTYCLKELKKMGWSVRLIETLLPKPTLKKNPMYACAAPVNYSTPLTGGSFHADFIFMNVTLK